ncbi:hypothetical protein [Paraglaciecola sp. MB-3u-78]|uniref:hypothetical protein n=1 Tax=Paraglaciecola sp. MB-3u-78 TaxID=2058332 RepID=UPI0012FE8DA6|nr:hypothetical protein [Paraglaciecola sp. MB-3u-78]
MIGQLVNDNCPIDLWPNGKAAEQNKINGSLEPKSGQSSVKPDGEVCANAHHSESLQLN